MVASNNNAEYFYKGIQREVGKCWNWPWHKSKDGHGKVNRKTAHRHSFELYHNVRLAFDLVVRHTCDNPACVNPEHLILGKNKDNVRDRHDRGRTFCVVTKNEVKEIKEKYASGIYTQARLGKIYGVGQDEISRIINNKRNLI